MAHTTLTDASYVAAQGARCPFCGSGNIAGDDFDVDGGTATQEISCSDCCKSWLDLYTLQGYQELA